MRGSGVRRLTVRPVVPVPPAVPSCTPAPSLRWRAISSPQNAGARVAFQPGACAMTSRFAPPSQSVPAPQRLLSLLHIAPAHSSDFDHHIAGQCNSGTSVSLSAFGQLVETGHMQHTVRQQEDVQQGTSSSAYPWNMIPVPPPVHIEPVTTLLVRNVSRSIGQDTAMQFWPHDTYGYNAFYVVYDLKKDCGAGLVFINFDTPEKAMAFRYEWEGVIMSPLSRVDGDGNHRALSIVDANLQGFKRIVEHWQQVLRVDVDAGIMPAIFIAGQRQHWPYVAHCLSGRDNASPALGVISL